MNSKVDDLIDRVPKWQNELKALRSILLDCGLKEEWKWRQPCYTYQEKNILILANFKAFCSLSFIKGVLLKDESNLLHKPGENSQSVRFFRFTNVDEILDQEALIKAYIFEAIEIKKSGQKVIRDENQNLDLPEELLLKFKELPELKKAFEALTPGRQRGYNLHFTGAKQAKSRMARIDKNTQRILDGYGYHDCVCGHSKKMPNCDGSHKYI